MTGLVVGIKSGHLLLLLLRSRWYPICLCFPLTHTFHRSRPIRLYFPMTFYRSYAVRFCLPVHTVLDCLWLWLLLLLLLQWIILWLLACILLISAKFAWVPVTIEWVLRNAAHPRIPRHFVSRHVGHTCYWDIKRNKGKEREREIINHEKALLLTTLHRSTTTGNLNRTVSILTLIQVILSTQKHWRWACGYLACICCCWRKADTLQWHLIYWWYLIALKIVSLNWCCIRAAIIWINYIWITTLHISSWLVGGIALKIKTHTQLEKPNQFRSFAWCVNWH